MTDKEARLYRAALGYGDDVEIPKEIVEQHNRYRAFRDRLRPSPMLDASEIATVVCLSWLKRETGATVTTERQEQDGAGGSTQDSPARPQLRRGRPRKLPVAAPVGE